MSYNKEYFLEASAGNAGSGSYTISKFGHNAAVGTTPTVISHGGIYRTPQVSGATQLRIKAGNVNDAQGGTGARKVRIEGLNAAGELTTEDILTNGASPGANSVNSYIRLYRAYVLESGTYGTQSAGSHAADVVVENAAGTEDWAIIDLDPAGFADGQTEIGAFTVPKGKNAYLMDIKYAVDATKVTSIFFYKRENILQTAAPYSAIRKQFGMEAAISSGEYTFICPIRFPELTDVGFLAFVDAGTGVVSVEFNLLIRDKE